MCKLEVELKKASEDLFNNWGMSEVDKTKLIVIILDVQALLALLDR